MPAYCPRCGSSRLERMTRPAASPTGSTAEALQQSSAYAAPSNNPLRRITNPLAGSRRHGERRGAERVRLKEAVEVRLSWHGPLRALDISATGLLVEHSAPFTPGSVCDVQLCRTGRTIRLRGQVVRSSWAAGEDGSVKGIRYRTGVQFLEIPQGMFGFLPELSKRHESSRPTSST